MRLFLLCLSFLVLAGCRNPRQPPPLVIGHVAALTGADAAAGKQAERGIKLALEDLGAKASAKLNDRPLVVRHVDAAGDLDVLEAAAARLVSVNGAIALLGGTSKEEAARLDHARVPVLSAAGSRPSGGDLVFTTGLPTARQGEALARYLAAEGAPVALVVDSGNADGQAGGNAFKKTWTEVAKKDAGRLQEFGLVPDPDIAKLAERVAQAKPKTVVVAGASATWHDLRRPWKGGDTRWAYIGPEGTLTGGDADKALIATSFALDREAARMEEFAKKYRSKFDEEPTVHAALAYDNVRLFVEALQQGQSRDPEKLRDELLKIKDFAGVTGPLSFDGQRQLRRPAFVAELHADGPPTALKTIAP